VIAWVLGVLMLGAVVHVLRGDYDWTIKTAVWVLLTVLLDECGGWFGYLSLTAGVLGLFSPTAEWYVILPLVGSGLLGLLLVMHAANVFAVPFAVAAFAVPIMLAREFGELLDARVTLPASQDFLTYTLGPAIVGGTVALAWRSYRVVAARKQRAVS